MSKTYKHIVTWYYFHALQLKHGDTPYEERAGNTGFNRDLKEVEREVPDCYHSRRKRRSFAVLKVKERRIEKRKEQRRWRIR